MKKLISLALVLVLALGALSVTAYACDLEHDGKCLIDLETEIMPRSPLCDECSSAEMRLKEYTTGYFLSKVKCDKSTEANPGFHVVSISGWWYVCPNCNNHIPDRSRSTCMESCTRYPNPCYPMTYLWHNY